MTETNPESEDSGEATGAAAAGPVASAYPGAGTAETSAGRPWAPGEKPPESRGEGSSADASAPHGDPRGTPKAAGEGSTSRPSAPAEQPIGADWPRFQSHKVIRAAKIVGVVHDTSTGDITSLSVRAGDGAPEGFTPTQAGMEGRVSIGDYALIYPDGFKSVSPAQSFEEGYSPYEDGPAAKKTVGTSLGIEVAEDGTGTVEATLAGETQPSVALPAGHRFFSLIPEMIRTFLRDVAGATEAPAALGEQPEPAVGARSRTELRTVRGAPLRPVAQPPIPPGQPPTPAQAALTPPIQPPVAGTPAPSRPANLR